MKCLVRKYPVNCASEENNEVWMYPWRNADEQGRPYTLEGYKYALCENVPDTPTGEEDDARMNIDNYVVEEHTEEIPSEDGEGTTTRRYWTATYNPQEETQ